MATVEQRIESGELKRGSLAHMEAMYRETREAFEEGRCSAAHGMGVFEALTGLLLDDAQEAVAAERKRIVALVRDFESTWAKRNRNAQSRLEPVFGAFAEAAGILAELIEGTDEDGGTRAQRPSEDHPEGVAEETPE